MKIFCLHEIGYAKHRNPWIITPDEFRKLVKNNPKAEFHFDDGRLGAYTFGAPILEEFNKKGKFFIVPTWIMPGKAPDHESYSEFMSYEQIKELADKGHTIGSHSTSHVNMTYLDYSTIIMELENSKETLQLALGIEIKEFSYPYGAVNGEVKKLSEEIYEKCYSLTSKLGIQREVFST